MPLASTPGLDDLGRNHVDQNLRERPAFGVPFEMVRGVVPGEGRVEDHRQEQIVPVVDNDELAAGALNRRVVDEVLLGAMGPDVTLEGKLARDDLLDRDLLVPAIAAVLLVAARLGDLLGAAQGAPRLGD